MSTLYLDSCDVGQLPLDRQKFLEPYHKDRLTSNSFAFRDDEVYNVMEDLIIY